MSTPVEIIEARQLTRENGPKLWEWADSKPHYGPDRQIDGLTVWTPEGRVWARFGDWIVKDASGASWAVKADEFGTRAAEQFPAALARAEQAEAANARMRQLIDSYPPGSDFVQCGAAQIFRDYLDGTKGAP